MYVGIIWCTIYSKKTVVVSLWNDLATTIGQELLDIADQSPVIAIKSLKVGDFQGNYNFSISIMFNMCEA